MRKRFPVELCPDCGNFKCPRCQHHKIVLEPMSEWSLCMCCRTFFSMARTGMSMRPVPEERMEREWPVVRVMLTRIATAVERQKRIALREHRKFLRQKAGAYIA